MISKVGLIRQCNWLTPCFFSNCMSSTFGGKILAHRQVHRRRKTENGSVLLVTIIITALICFTLASYLHLVSQQNQSITRSLSWNTAMPVAEAGIEEALAHLNQNITNRAVDGWQVNGTNVVMERTLGDAKYKVWINSVIDPPRILAQGQVQIPVSDRHVTRGVLVRTKKDALFAKALVAKGEIDLNGSGIMTDSFDTTDPNYHTGGRYDPAKAKDNGDVASNSTIKDSISVGNAHIYGHVSTGPGGSVSVGNGMVGNKAFHANPANAGKIQGGWFKDDMNVQFPDAKVPAGLAFAPLPGVVGGTNYTYVLPAGKWELPDLKSSKARILVTGDAILHVKGEISLSGKAEIIVAPGGNLNLYAGGPTTKITGQGFVNDGSALNFAYHGLPTNTEVHFGGNASFTGTIYAPNAYFHLGGGGNDGYDFVGAAIVNNVKMNGHFAFHYDEALAKIGPFRGYLVDSWQENMSWTEL